MNASTRRLVELYGDQPVRALAGKPDPIVGEPVRAAAREPWATIDDLEEALDWLADTDGAAIDYLDYPDAPIEDIQQALLVAAIEEGFVPDPRIALQDYEDAAMVAIRLRQIRDAQPEVGIITGSCPCHPWDALRSLITYQS